MVDSTIITRGKTLDIRQRSNNDTNGVCEDDGAPPMMMKWRVSRLPTSSSHGAEGSDDITSTSLRTNCSPRAVDDDIAPLITKHDRYECSPSNQSSRESLRFKVASQQLMLQRIFGRDRRSDRDCESEAATRATEKASSLPSINEASSHIGGEDSCYSDDSKSLDDHERTEALGNALRAAENERLLFQAAEVSRAATTVTRKNDEDWSAEVGFSQSAPNSSRKQFTTPRPPTVGDAHCGDNRNIHHSRPSGTGRLFLGLKLRRGGRLVGFGGQTDTDRYYWAIKHKNHELKTSNVAAVETRDATGVPERSSHEQNNHNSTPRPIWAELRRRTLRVTQDDPSIFSRGIQRDPSCCKELAGRPPRCGRGWHIMNRRIFGLGEVTSSKKGHGVPQPEWLLFEGGVPQRSISEPERWMLRLGHGTHCHEA